MTTTPNSRTNSSPASTPDSPVFPGNLIDVTPSLSTAILAVLPDELTQLEAVYVIEQVIAGVQDRAAWAVDGDSRRADVSNESLAVATAARASGAQEQRREAARYAEYSARANLRAAEIEQADPLKAYADRAAERATRARERVEERMSAKGRFRVDVDAHDAADGFVHVSPETLIGKGWHHKDVCTAVPSAPTDSPLVPDHELIRQAWQAVYDWHDEEHGNGLWHGCATQPCAGVPAAFRAEPWHHQDHEECGEH